MGILEALNEYLYCSGTIGKVKSFGFSLKAMKICGKRFFLFLLNIHEVT